MSMDLSRMGRFSEPALLIMVTLVGGELHGYALMEDIKRSFGVELGPGTLYGAIARLERQGLIEAVEGEERRRPYRLTQQGETELRLQLESMQQIAAVGLNTLATR